MKLKYLVAALGLVAATASQATITAGSTTGSAEAFLTVYDSHGSYSLDLGLTFNALQSLGSAVTFTLTGANWTSFLSGADPAALQFAVLDSNSNNGGTNNAAIFSTVNVDFVGQIPANFDSDAIQAAQGQVVNYANALNTTGTHGTTANGDNFSLPATPGYFLTLATDSFNNAAYINSNAADFATAYAVETVRRVNTGFFSPTETAWGTAQFGLNGGSGYQLVLTPVPEPTGLGLAVAGLSVLGFIGVRRRNRG